MEYTSGAEWYSGAGERYTAPGPPPYAAIPCATCTGTDAAPGYTTRPSCENMFAAVTTQAHCRSYHLCNAEMATVAAMITAHCGHATGINLCGN